MFSYSFYSTFWYELWIVSWIIFFPNLKENLTLSYIKYSGKTEGRLVFYPLFPIILTVMLAFIISSEE